MEPAAATSRTAKTRNIFTIGFLLARQVSSRRENATGVRDHAVTWTTLRLLCRYRRDGPGFGEYLADTVDGAAASRPRRCAVEIFRRGADGPSPISPLAPAGYPPSARSPVAPVPPAPCPLPTRWERAPPPSPGTAPRR